MKNSIFSSILVVFFLLNIQETKPVISEGANKYTAVLSYIAALNKSFAVSLPMIGAQFAGSYSIFCFAKSLEASDNLKWATQKKYEKKACRGVIIALLCAGVSIYNYWNLKK
jgi:hypothetical protein